MNDRDEFAKAAMAALIPVYGPAISDSGAGHGKWTESLIKDAFAIADEAMKARGEQEQGKPGAT